MPVSRIIRAGWVGETWWLALNENSQPVCLHLERPASDALRARLGERLEARVASLSSALAGVFLDLKGKPVQAFLRAGKGLALHQGQGIRVDIVSEARQGKLARAIIAQGEAGPVGAGRWRAGLTGGDTAVIEDRLPGDIALESAWDLALDDTQVLSGGGKLTCERARALTVADIDTAGRAGRGSAGARAHSVNIEAAQALARKMQLSGLGGLAVLDCTGPLNHASGEKIRTAFLAEWTAISRSPVKALAPSLLGLMEISAPWTVTPLAERVLDEHGRPRAESVALLGLKTLEKAATEDRLSRLTLRLPQSAWKWLAASGLEADGALAAKYGERCAICPADIDKPDVSRA